MKKIFACIMLFVFCTQTTIAVEFDTSIDDEIRKTYNIEEQNLPALPKASPNVQKETPKTEISKTVEKYNPTGKTYILKNGTKIELISQNILTDLTPKGSIVTFKAKNGFVAKDGTIIPSGTVFKGRVVNSHASQITGNGGLLAIEVNEIYFNGVRSKINSKTCNANSKKIFFNNIKGERKYWKNYSKVMSPSRKYFGKTQKCAGTMAAIPVVNLLAFVPLLTGAVFYGISFVSAPVISIFKKGGKLTVPAGSVFEIKLTKNIEIHG